MSFSSLKDPADLARASAALEKVWVAVKPSIEMVDRERERERLAFIVAGLASLAIDEDDLSARSLEKYRRGR